MGKENNRIANRITDIFCFAGDDVIVFLRIFLKNFIIDSLFGQSSLNMASLAYQRSSLPGLLYNLILPVFFILVSTSKCTIFVVIACHIDSIEL